MCYWYLRLFTDLLTASLEITAAATRKTAPTSPVQIISIGIAFWLSNIAFCLEQCLNRDSWGSDRSSMAGRPVLCFSLTIRLLILLSQFVAIVMQSNESSDMVVGLMSTQAALRLFLLMTTSCFYPGRLDQYQHYPRPVYVTVPSQRPPVNEFENVVIDNHYITLPSEPSIDNHYIALHSEPSLALTTTTTIEQTSNYSLTTTAQQDSVVQQINAPVNGFAIQIGRIDLSAATLMMLLYAVFAMFFNRDIGHVQQRLRF